MNKQHDADLCERLRKLEEKVRELEARPPVIAYPPVYVYPYWDMAHHCYPGCFHHFPNTITWGSNTTIGSTYVDNSGTQSTYTLTSTEQ